MKKALSVLKFLAVLYLFFLCIELMGGSFKLIGKEAAKNLLTVTDNPLVGLLIGILATSIMQSSSTTTSIVVGMVGAGTLTITQAVPMVMGANIGTTITNTIVSMGHIRLRKEFELAFTGATVHDFFNLCAVILFLPLEWAFGLVQKSATFLSEIFVGVGGATFNSPLKAIVKPVVKWLHGLGLQIVEKQYQTIVITALNDVTLWRRCWLTIIALDRCGLGAQSIQSSLKGRNCLSIQIIL